MGNLASEQIRADLSLEVAPDQVLSSLKQRGALIRFLGRENCEIQDILGHKVLVYKKNDINFILLHKAVSYLGGNGQHPIYKKRIQLSSWYKDFCLEIEKENLPYDVRFIGVYHYDGAIVFVDFLKSTYLKKKVHNSSAHIYINDLYQALTNGVFHKEDQYGNHLYAVRANKFADYLIGKEIGTNHIFSLFNQFNHEFDFGKWLSVLPAVKEMERANWSQWKQTEWPGWYLEYKFYNFTIEKHTAPIIIYTGISNKAKDKFDFDIWFEQNQFYGDLKASDITKSSAPGNDQSTFIECINQYGKFWYVIYEHETEKDSEANNYENVRAYNKYMNKDELSYSSRLKTGVKFMKMTILELNRINFREALSTFNQGHQPDGSHRNPKFLIKKKDIDRFVVFRYKYSLDEKV